jgi:cell division protein ZapA
VSAEHVTVRIYGESYPLRTGESAARLEELARHVDQRMREVASSGKVVVTSKIAVLAALHIADELFRLRDERSSPPVGDDAQRIAALVEQLDALLAPVDRADEP